MSKLLIVNPRSMKSQMSYLHHLNFLSQNTSLELFLICENADRQLLDGRVSVIEVPRRGNRLFFAITLYRKAANLIIKSRIDWVISSYGHFNALLVLFLIKARYTKRCTAVLFYDLRSASVSGVMDALQNKIYSIESCCYDHNIAVSKQAAQKVFGKKQSLACFISGVGSFSSKAFASDNGQDELIELIKNKYRINENTLVLLYIGTLSHRGLDMFIESFTFDDKDFCFFIIGDGDKISETRLAHAIEKKGLSLKVHLLGRLPYQELPVFLLLANVGIAYVPEHESLSSQPFTKIQEYAEFKTLVLASDNLSKNQFIKTAEVVFLSEFNCISKLKSYLELNRKTLYRNKPKGVCWAELSEQLYIYLKSNPS